MAFTFDPTLSTPRDWLRADLGDTDEATALFGDEQIAAVLAAERGNRHTAKLCLAAQAEAAMVREPVKLDAAGAVYDYSDRLTALKPLAAAWRALEAARAAVDATTPTTPAHQTGSTHVRVRGVW
ncbi:MAG: hypothetical protein WCG26_09965 [Chloroflexales bacterium]